MFQNIKNKIRNDIVKRLNYVSARIRDEDIYRNLLSIKSSTCEISQTGKKYCLILRKINSINRIKFISKDSGNSDSTPKEAKQNPKEAEQKLSNQFAKETEIFSCCGDYYFFK